MSKRQKTVFFVDPQSYHNLSNYDYALLSRIKDCNCIFFGSKLYDYKPLPKRIGAKLIFSYSNKKHIITKVLSYVWSNIVLLSYAIIYRPEIYHFQWIRTFHIDFPLIWILKNILKAKIIFTVHDILPRSNPNKIAFKKLYDFCDTLIAHTDTTKRNLITNFGQSPTKIVVMQHGVLDINVNKKDVEKIIKATKSKYNIKHGDIVISCLGEAGAYKGTDLVVEAWYNMNGLKNNCKAHLLLCGRYTQSCLKNNVPQNLHCISRTLTNAEFKAFLQMSDLSVMAYRSIDQSGLLLSILQEKIPYCCTNVGELARPLSMANVGWIIPTPTIEDVGKTIVNAIENPKQLNDMKRNVEWGKIQHAYSWDNSAAILQKVYLQK